MSLLPILTTPSPVLPPNPTFYTPTPSRQLLALVKFLAVYGEQYDFERFSPALNDLFECKTEKKKRRHFRSLLTKSITGVDEFLDTSLIGRGPDFGTEEQKREASRVIAVHLLFSLVLLMLEGSDNFIKAGVTGDTLNLQFHESFGVKTMAEMMSSCRIM
jgi:hypothetical protein